MLVSGNTYWIYTDGAGNGTKIMSDGSIRFVGTARVFDDLIGDVMSKRLFSTTGTVSFDFDENTIEWEPGGSISDNNDRIAFNLQYPHNAVIGDNSFFKLHFHWFQDATTDFSFAAQYRIQNNGKPKETSWTTITASTTDNSIFSYTGGTLNQITVFPEIDVTGCDVSSTVQFRFARTDSETGDAHTTFIDAHYAIDSQGSIDEFSKN